MLSDLWGRSVRGARSVIRVACVARGGCGRCFAVCRCRQIGASRTHPSSVVLQSAGADLSSGSGCVGPTESTRDRCTCLQMQTQRRHSALNQPRKSRLSSRKIESPWLVMPEERPAPNTSKSTVPVNCTADATSSTSEGAVVSASSTLVSRPDPHSPGLLSRFPSFHSFLTLWPRIPSSSSSA